MRFALERRGANLFALDAEKYAGKYDKICAVTDGFVDFMMRVVFEQVLPHKSVAEASESRETRREYRKNAIISSHCLELPHCRENYVGTRPIINC